MKSQLVLSVGSAFLAMASGAELCGRRNSNPSLMSALQPDDANYIAGGKIAIEHEFPWQISIQAKVRTRSGTTVGEHFCGGSLINDFWIVTAAHCILDGLRIEDYFIVVGGQHLGDVRFPVQRRGASRIVVHPLWDKTTLQNDIALIKMDGGVLIRQGDAAPICLPASYDAKRFHGTCVTSGWGSFYPNTPPSPSLLKVDLPIVPTEFCAEHYPNVTDGRIIKDILCAGKYGAGPCHGDGGNPLACEVNGVYYLAGISSVSTCGSNQYPAAFTRVSSHRTWIQAYTSYNQASGLGTQK